MKYSKFKMHALLSFKNSTLFLMLAVLISFSCRGQEKNFKVETSFTESEVATYPVVGANQTGEYLPFLRNKRVGVVANQTTVVFKPENFIFMEDYWDESSRSYRQRQTQKWLFSKRTHLVDSLLAHRVNVTKVFAPEHGFRGTADAGELVKDGKDSRTGLPIISLYGSNKKPTPEQMKDLDVMIFDIQDVGARFYTYISSLHYVMEACAEAEIPLLILDRPNPNIHYIDGPILEPEHKSFVGMHPVPVVHGMTIAEYAQMINGEGWLENGLKCELKIVPVKEYSRTTFYSLPIKPSPNLPNDMAINLYPSTCFFEGTTLSEGRGTDKQFQVFGSPTLPKEKYTFTFRPEPNEGAKNPKFNGELCYGKDLSDTGMIDHINLQWLIDAYNDSGKPKGFFSKFFTTLAGTKTLQQQIEQGMDMNQIRLGWKEGLEKYESIRKQYMLY